ncbi:MAG: tRNA U34 5-methylaminomethyl-2-thiouridine-forming methyltransferase MnmC [Bacteroidia bacterium]|jgi:tRNA U34 5-methylaminomethyl-2-thiouridine-forming methyltransferase MnmC
MSDKLDNESKVLSRRIVVTADGSTSIEIPEMDEMYHSKKGAIQESQFVYVDHGLALLTKPNVDVLEIGMGTGLNLLLFHLYAEKNVLTIHYCTLEPYPLTENEWQHLNYEALLDVREGMVKRIHSAEPNVNFQVSDFVNAEVHHSKLEDWTVNGAFDLVLFDAFAPNKQSNPWVLSNIKKLYDLLRPGGILTTYCAQGQFKRNLQSVGFEVTNPKGPMGKREITVAIKN